MSTDITRRAFSIAASGALAAAAATQKKPIRFGGPIWIPGVFKGTDKAFFFVNYELYLLPEATFRARTILSPQAQSGIFQYVTSTGTQSVNLLNLATTATAGGCTACTNTLDPTTSKLLSDIRNSTNGVGDVKALSDPNLNTFSFINKGGQDRVFPTVRLDFNITPKHHLENIWNYNYFGGLVDFLNGVDPAFPGFPNHGSQVSRRFSNVTALRSTLTSTLVNEARYGITGGTVLFFAEVNPGQFSNQGGYNLGIGAAGITSATVTNGPSRRNAPVKQFTDTLTWTKGSHSLNFGGTFSQINFWGIAQTMVPSISFGIDTSDPATSMFTSANFPGASAAQISSAAALYSVLTGHVTAINGNARLDEKTNQYKYLGPQTERDRQREFGLFLQDSWRFRPNLTLTGGLRWEVQMPFQALNNSYSKVTWNALWGESGPGNLFKPGTLAGSPTTYSNFVPGDTTYTTQYKNVAPSVGFAWTPNVKNSLLKKIVGDGGQTVVRGGYSIAYNREGMNVVSSILAANPGIAITTNRNLTLGNLVGGSLGSQPLLLRESARLGAPAFVSAPTYPNSGLITDSANAFNPNLKMGYVQSWSFGVQRELSKDTVVEVRYVGNRGVKLWNQYSLNEVNNIENGFLNEFKLAQANLQANIAAGRGSNFKYFGAGTGTSPLPIMLAFISGLPASAAGTASNYSSTLWSNATFVNALAINGPSIGTFSGIGTSQGNFITNATFRNNGIAAGLPANFFLANPGKLGGAFTIENNGRTWYDAGVLEVRRRMSKGLLVQGSYTFTKSTINAPVSSSAVFYQPRSLRNLNDKTLSPFGITHAVKANWIYEMPFGKGKTFLNGVGGAMNQLVGGWEFHGLARLQSGSPNDFGNVQLVGLTRTDHHNTGIFCEVCFLHGHKSQRYDG